MPRTQKTRNSASANERRHQRMVMKRAFDLIEAMESEPHIGMANSKKLWGAYANLTRSLGGNPMNQWWKNQKLHNNDYTTGVA